MNIPVLSPLFPLLCASILTSSFALAITAFAFSVSPFLWIVPVTFIITFIIHAIFFFLANSEEQTSGSLRLFSATLIAAFFFATAAWAGSTVVLVLCTVRLLKGLLPTAPHDRHWAIITASAVSLLETALLAVIAVRAYKFRQHLRYREKWKWRPGATSSQWSITQT